MPRDADDIQEDLPSTLERSPEKAKRTYAKAKASAEEQYGEGERAERTAWSQVKEGFEKRGDHWSPKTRGAPPTHARSRARRRRR
jgi:cation transport regulator ChaB